MRFARSAQNTLMVRCGSQPVAIRVLCVHLLASAVKYLLGMLPADAIGRIERPAALA